MTTRDKVKKIYEDRKFWQPAKPPSIRFIAKRIGVTVGTVHRYVKELQ